MPSSPSRTEKINELTRELDRIDQIFWGDYYEHTSQWQLQIGPIRMRRHMPSGTIAKLYLLICFLAVIGGGTGTFFEPTKELGIALIVGAIFAGGSFVVQWWAVQVQNERTVHQEIFGKERYREFRMLLQQRESLVGKIERLDPAYFGEDREAS